jgi:Tol biopolymer transport system component
VRALAAALVTTVLLTTACAAAERRQAALPSPEEGATLAPAGLARNVTTLAGSGGRVAWSAAHGLVAFDRQEGGRPYGLYTMRPDGSDQRCLTCGRAGAPAGHKGNPAWHPSGQYLVFQAEKPSNRPGAVLAAPGRGVRNDVWVTTADGSSYTQLTDVGAGGGVLHPQFSPDGARLLWAERLGAGPNRGDTTGEWAIKLADFTVSGGTPRVQNVRTFQPGGPVFYETHGFSPDGSTILYSANPEPGQTLFGLDVYAMNLQTQAVRRLTTTVDQWDEHAHYSPDGRYIVWMSSMGCGCTATRAQDLKTDFWIMDADGANKRQITFFNDDKSPHAALTRTKKVAADSSWSPDGTQLVAYVITGVDEGPIVRIDLDVEALRR